MHLIGSTPARVRSTSLPSVLTTHAPPLLRAILFATLLVGFASATASAHDAPAMPSGTATAPAPSDCPEEPNVEKAAKATWAPAKPNVDSRDFESVKIEITTNGDLVITKADVSGKQLLKVKKDALKPGDQLTADACEWIWTKKGEWRKLAPKQSIGPEGEAIDVIEGDGVSGAVLFFELDGEVVEPLLAEGESIYLLASGNSAVSHGDVDSLTAATPGAGLDASNGSGPSGAGDVIVGYSDDAIFDGSGQVTGAINVQSEGSAREYATWLSLVDCSNPAKAFKVKLGSNGSWQIEIPGLTAPAEYSSELTHGDQILQESWTAANASGGFDEITAATKLSTGETYFFYSHSDNGLAIKTTRICSAW